MKSTQCERMRTDTSSYFTVHDRRSRVRYAIALELEYKLTHGKRKGETGTGRTMNISSGGAYFTTGQALMAGIFVQLTVPWPALLHGTVPIKLIIRGVVVRASTTHAAIKVESHDFYIDSTALMTAVRAGAC